MSIIVNVMALDSGAFSIIPIQTIGAGIISVIIMVFMKQAEGIVKKIFGFDNASSLGSVITSGALLLGSLKSASNISKNFAGSSGSSGGSSSGGGSSSSGGSSGSSSSSGTSSKPQTSSNADRNMSNTNTSSSKNKSSSSSQSSSKKSDSNKKSGGERTSDKSDYGSKRLDNPPTESENTTGDRASTSSSSGRDTYNSDRSESNESRRKLNTDSTQTKGQRVASAMGKFLATQAKVGMYVTGAALGAISSDDALRGIGTGMALTKPINAVATNLGKKAHTNLKNGPRPYRMTAQRNDIIDAYNDLQTSTGWNDDRMFKEAETLIKVKDVSKIRNEKRRTFATTLQKHRVEFEGKYEEPNDMVLDTIEKIQRGEITKNTTKIYTRKKNTTK